MDTPMSSSKAVSSDEGFPSSPESQLDSQERELAPNIEPDAKDVKENGSLLAKSTDVAEWGWRDVVLTLFLWIAAFFCFVANSQHLAFFPLKAEEKGASPAVIGLLNSISPLCITCLSTPFGYLLPSCTVGFVVFTSLFLVGTSLVLFPLAFMVETTSSFIVLIIVLKIADGAGNAMFVSASYSLLPHLFPRHVGKMTALFGLALGLGSAVGAPLGGILYHYGGIRLPLLGIGFSILALIFPTSFVIGTLSGKIQESNNKKCCQSLEIKTILQFSTDVIFISLTLVGMLAVASAAFYSPTLQPYMVEQFGLNSIEIGFLFFAKSMGYLVSELILNQIPRKRQVRSLSAVGLLVIAVGFILIGLPPLIGYKQVWLVCVAYAMTGVGAGVSTVPLHASMLRLGERHLGKKESKDALASSVSRILLFSLSFGGFLGPLLGGTLGELLHFPMSGVIFGELLLATAMLLLGLTATDAAVRRIFEKTESAPQTLAMQ